MQINGGTSDWFRFDSGLAESRSIKLMSSEDPYRWRFNIMQMLTVIRWVITDQLGIRYALSSLFTPSAISLHKFTVIFKRGRHFSSRFLWLIKDRSSLSCVKIQLKDCTGYILQVGKWSKKVFKKVQDLNAFIKLKRYLNVLQPYQNK